MKKEILGLTRKELLVYAFCIMSSLVLVIYSSGRLIHKYYTRDKIMYTEIQNHSKDLAYLNDLGVYSMNMQRNSLNILVYKSNPSQVLEFLSIIKKNRDSLSYKLDKIKEEDIVDRNEREQISKSGVEYLKRNAFFMQMLIDSATNDELSSYNTNKMRPAIREFSDLNRKCTQDVTQKIKNIASNSANIFYQLEFWLLLIGLSPYFYFTFRVLAIIFRMVVWELFL